MINQYYGIYQAVVTNIDDPEKRGRIKVLCPTVLGAKTESAWCDPCVPVAYDGGGDFCLPKLKETVWLTFIEGDVNKPAYLGGWWSKNNTPLGSTYTDLDDVRIIGYNDCSMVMQNKEIDLRATSVKVNGVPISSGGGSSEEIEEKIEEAKEEILGEIEDLRSELSDFKEEFIQCCSDIRSLIEGMKEELLEAIHNITPDEPDKRGTIYGDSITVVEGNIVETYSGNAVREE